MTPILLLVALLLFVLLMIRLSRQTGKAGGTPAWVKVVRSLFLLIALGLGLVYCWFRIQRAHADVERSRKTATELVSAMDGYESDRSIASALITPVVGGEVLDSVETLVDLAQGGDISRLQQAAQHARYCLAEVGKDMGPLELLFFTQPTPCRAMFHTLGEPADLADAGATFGNMAARAAGSRDPGEPRGPACREWKLERVELTMPRSKDTGAEWDIGGNPPDPVVTLRVGSGERLRSPVAQDRHELQWKPSKPVVASPGTKIQVQVHDADAIDDDFAFGYEAIVPTNSGSRWVIGEHPNEVTITLDCGR
jgi:hypothetical protein